jgi:hypothetical protein
MNQNIYSLPVTFSVENEISDGDNRFIEVFIDVLHLGRNLNGSVFSQDVVDANIDTIKNTPILGFVQVKSDGEKDFKGHEYTIKRTVNGVEQVYSGSAYGVVPESYDAQWVDKMCDDGEMRTFLRVKGLLWTKFSDSTEIVMRDIIKQHSMELYPNSIEGHEDDNGDFVFDKFSFDGCCILSDDVQPAMVNSCVEVNYSVSDFVKNLQDELNDKFAVFTKLIDKQNEQGGVKNMPEDIKNDEVIEDVNPDFSEQVDDSQSVSDDNQPASDFASTMMQQFEDISNIVSSQETVKDKWGYDAPRYYAVDIQDNEVIVVDAKDNYNYYGIPYTIDGDKPVLDFACGTRKKVRYENYEDGAVMPTGAFSFGEYISSIEKNASEKIEKVEAEYSQVKSELDEIKPKYDEYVAAEAEREVAEINAAKDAKFAEYEDVLGDNAEFEAIKEKREELSVDEIEKECAVLYVKATRAAKTNFSKNSNAAVIGVMNDGDDDVIDGYVSTKYGYIKKRY